MVLDIFVITGSLYTVSLLKRLARLDSPEITFKFFFTCKFSRRTSFAKSPTHRDNLDVSKINLMLSISVFHHLLPRIPNLSVLTGWVLLCSETQSLVLKAAVRRGARDEPQRTTFVIIRNALSEQKAARHFYFISHNNGSRGRKP